MTIITYLNLENTLTDLAHDNQFLQAVTDNPEVVKIISNALTT